MDNTQPLYKHDGFNKLFNNSNINYFFPKQFPNHIEWIELAQKRKASFRALYHNKFHEQPHDAPSVSIRAWLALGFSWLRKYTKELLPWFELLPSPYYLPMLWPYNETYKLLKNSETMREIDELYYEFGMVYPYLSMLGLTEIEVKEAYALLISRVFQVDFNGVNGEQSVIIPSGFDFFNHDVMGSSDIFYEQLFGAKNVKSDQFHWKEKVNDICFH